MPDPRYEGNYVAPEGQIWRCGACGRLSRDRYGNQALSASWDESCFMNAVLCYYPPEAEITERYGSEWKAVEPEQP